jgi:hypothetical protein
MADDDGRPNGDYSRLVLPPVNDNLNERKLHVTAVIRDGMETLIKLLNECSKEAPELNMPIAELKAAQTRVYEALEVWQRR